MNSSSVQSAFVLSRPLAHRVGGGVREALHTALFAMERAWHDHKLRSDELRRFDSVAHLNAHVLKDIGAPHWLVAQATGRREAEHQRWMDMELR
jgi:hypothetical protein